MRICCVFLLLPFALPVGGEPALNLFFEVPLSKGFGTTSCDLSYDAGGGDQGLSRLEFPAGPFTAGYVAVATIEDDGRRRWLFEVGFAHSMGLGAATMEESTLHSSAGSPPVLRGYTESTDNMVSTGVSAEIAWTFASAGPASFALGAAYDYERCSHSENGRTGWRSQWNGTTYDVIPIDDPDVLALSYTMSAHRAGVGLLADLRPIPGLDIDVRAFYTPVFASDSDDHVWLSRLSTASGWGNGVQARVRSSYRLPQIRPDVIPYIVLDGGLEYFVVDTWQMQYWYGNSDPAVPQGTTVTGVEHLITNLQFHLSLGVGLAF